MKIFSSKVVVLALVLCAALLTCNTRLASAQETAASIDYPQSGNTVSGTVKVLLRNIPAGGYVAIHINMASGNRLQSFRTATSQTSYQLNTSALSDGPHTLTAVSFGPSGRTIGQSSVTFNVQNAGSVGVSEDSVALVNWLPRDVVNPKVQRYRVFAVSDATITGNESEGGSEASSSSPLGSSSLEKEIKAPLDRQIDLLLRRTVRDVGMLEGSANVRVIVQEAFERQRIGEGGGAGAAGASSGRSSRKKKVVGKQPWNPEWMRGAEASQSYTKMIKQNGDEINATRKPATLPLGDILPNFPAGRVARGATWNANLLVVGELSKRLPIRLNDVPVSLTDFENLQTPAGFERRCAKIEVSRVSLPDDVAMKIARALQSEEGGAKGSGGSGASSSGLSASEAEEELPVITVARAEMTRTLWFDIAANQLVRSEDVVDSYYEEEPQTEGSSAPAFASGPPGATATPVMPKTVTYKLRVVKFLDDRLPPPTNSYTGGRGTAHSRDSVRDPDLTRANGNDTNR
jgi:hypothetical protein